MYLREEEWGKGNSVKAARQTREPDPRWLGVAARQLAQRRRKPSNAPASQVLLVIDGLDQARGIKLGPHALR